VIDVWKIDGTHSVNSQAMTEIAGGFYKYDFTTYSSTSQYVILSDGGAGLSGSDRYVYSTNEVNQEANYVVIAFFSDGGTPKTGLTPTIEIWDSDATKDVDGASMTEITNGFYKYTFATYDNTKDYGFLADGGATLADYERYAYGTNQTTLTATGGQTVKVSTSPSRVTVNVK